MSGSAAAGGRLARVGLDEYRRDVDGLRAIAVLSVIVYHGQSHWLPGGFVGVDIFFVISGYLISRNIAQTAALGRFSFVEFYRRRIRRIAPAMLVVVAAVLLAAALLMTPDDAQAVAKSAVWSLASMANVFFWRELDVGYFAPSSAEVPLLHLWSLGVEEQFYLVWPVLLALAVRHLRTRWVLAVIGVLALASFAGAQALLPGDPMFAYYMLPTRAGELLVGAAVGVASATGRLALPRVLARAAAAAGLLLVAAALVLLDHDAPFPGWRALPPTLGAALIILAGEGATAAPLAGLATRPMVFVGKISYSAYLWHWPLFAFYRHGYGEPSAVLAAAIVGATLLLAWLSFRFVERPTRSTAAPMRTVLLRQFVLPTAVLGAVALVIVFGPRHGLPAAPRAYLDALAAVRESARPAFGFDWICQRQRLREVDLTNPNCEFGPSGATQRPLLIWGDSNAAHYVPMLREFTLAAGVRLRNVEIGSCPPLIADPAPYVEARRRLDCADSNRLVQRVLAGFGTIVLAADWTTYAARSPALYDDLRRTAAQLVASGHRVVLVGRAPRIAGFDRRCREKALRFPAKDCPVFNDPLDAEVTAVNARLKSLSGAMPGLHYFDANDWLCPSGRCPDRLPDGRPVYFDGGHLTVVASEAIGRSIVSRAGIPAAFSH